MRLSIGRRGLALGCKYTLNAGAKRWPRQGVRAADSAQCLCSPFFCGNRKSCAFWPRACRDPANLPLSTDPTLKKASTPDLTASAREWPQILAGYRNPSYPRSILEFAITAGAFAILWFLMWAALGVGYWLSLIMAVPAAGFLVRLFMIQHDCGHGAFFRRRAANDWLGRLIGPLTLTPYDVWRRSHAVHHANIGRSRATRHRRCHHPDRSRIPGIAALAPVRLSALPQPHCVVRPGPRLSVHRAASTADRLDVGGMATLAQHHGHQRRDRAHRPGHDVAGGRPALPARAFADHAAGSLYRRLAVLRPTPIPGHLLGRGSCVEPARSGSARQLTLRPAGRPALVHGQYRHASRAPSLQSHPLLPAPPRAARPSRARGSRPAHADAEPGLRAAGAVGRDAPPVDFAS